MASPRTNVPADVRSRLIDEAGGKCANPGCTSYRTHLHHIDEWAVYGTHDEQAMIAICPTCHDAVHNGPLAIDDDKLRRWKEIPRTKVDRDHLYVEPSGVPPKLLIGTVAVTGDQGVLALNFDPSSKLGFRIEDGDLMLMDVAIADATGNELLKIIAGHVKHDIAPPVTYERVPGHIRVAAPLCDTFIPSPVVEKVRIHDPDFASNGDLALLDLEVIEPGIAQAQGVWNSGPNWVVITERVAAFVVPNKPQPISITGAGKDSVVFAGYGGGPVTTALFGFEESGTASQRHVSKHPRNELCYCGSGLKFKKCHGR